MAERVGIGLGLDPQLAAGYELLQGAMNALEEHDVDQLMDLLFTKWDVPAPFQTVLKTLRKNSEGVYNATVLPYSNGRVEGINRMIKLIQRTAYGFTNFGHFIARIRLHQMGTEAEKKAPSTGFDKEPKLTTLQFCKVLRNSVSRNCRRAFL